jgi:phage shock protein PspC (stress-responsive transcriptional regulator)
VNDRLYRSVHDRVLAGVCGGLAQRLGVDPSLVRVACVVVALLSGIFPILIVYVIMAVVVPEEPSGPWARSPTPPGPGAVPGWTPPGGPAAQPAPHAVDEQAPLGGPGALPAVWPATPPAPTTGPPVSRPRDPLLGVVAGLVLVGLGGFLLLRDRVPIDWAIVGAAGLIALGAVLIIAALRPRR